MENKDYLKKVKLTRDDLLALLPKKVRDKLTRMIEKRKQYEKVGKGA